MLLKLLLIPFMTIMSRAHGGGKPSIPYGLDAFILAAPYLLLFDQTNWPIIPAYFLSVLGLRLGHGRGFNYALPFKPGSTPEKVEYLIPKNLPVRTQKILIMVLTGLAVTVGPSIAVAIHGHYLTATLLALSGLSKALCYMLPKTNQSEMARGFCLGTALTIAL